MLARISVVFLLLFSFLFAAPVMAQNCDAWFRFDGDLTDSSGKGYDGQMIAAGGQQSTPTFVPGRTGQALHLTGINAMRAFIDLHPESCPQMTIAAWVQIEPEPSQMIVGNNGGNRLFSSVDGISVRTTGKDLWADGNPVRASGGWMFVAAVWDYEREFHRLHWRTRSKEEDLAGRKPGAAEDAVWIGADNDKLHQAAKNIVIDEIRFISRALSTDEVLALRREGLDTTTSADQISALSPASAAGQMVVNGGILTGVPSSLLPGDQFACQMLPGDQFSCRMLPGDQFDLAALPGDQFSLRALPGDQFIPNQLPGDQFAPTQLPGDQFTPTQLPGDQFTPSRSPTDREDSAEARLEDVIDIPLPDTGNH